MSVTNHLTPQGNHWAAGGPRGEVGAQNQAQGQTGTKRQSSFKPVSKVLKTGLLSSEKKTVWRKGTC